MSYLVATGKMLKADNKFLIKPPVPPVQITDYDGNVYTEVVVGTQTWLTPNLRTTHWNNGNAIAKPANAAAWQTDYDHTTGQMCFYGFDDASADMYGGYYNWYVFSNSSDLCPAGYRLPVKADFDTLAAYVASEGTKSQGLMSTSLTYWTQGLPSPGVGTDVYGFDARGAGDNDWNGAFLNNRTAFIFGYNQTGSGLHDTATNNGVAIQTNFSIQYYQGCSLRCIKI